MRGKILIFIVVILCLAGDMWFIINLTEQWSSLTENGAIGRTIILIMMLAVTCILPDILEDAFN